MAQIVDEGDAGRVIKDMKHQGMFVVLHQGCYEILHAGHLACFSAGKSFRVSGKKTYLAVGVESDSTLCLNREDKTRPLFSQNERCEVIAEIGTVDLVVRFKPTETFDYADVPHYVERLRKIKPDAFLISYNHDMSYFQQIASAQTRECAEAGVLILPVIHHVATRATQAVNLLNRQGIEAAAHALLWQPSYKPEPSTDKS